MRRETYKKELGYQDNEIPARYDLETKEFSKVPNKKNNIPKDMQTFGITEKGWKKSFDHSWDYLDTVLSDLEMRVVLKLCRMAEMNTNSLKPLSDETTQIEISETFNIDRRKAKIMFEKLYKIGIYGRFDVYDESLPYTKFWILNPYLSFGGQLIKSDIANLFKGTTLTKEYYKRMSVKAT